MSNYYKFSPNPALAAVKLFRQKLRELREMADKIAEAAGQEECTEGPEVGPRTVTEACETDWLSLAGDLRSFEDTYSHRTEAEAAEIDWQYWKSCTGDSQHTDDDVCPGWFVCSDSGRVQRCYDCGILPRDDEAIPIAWGAGYYVNADGETISEESAKILDDIRWGAHPSVLKLILDQFGGDEKVRAFLVAITNHEEFEHDDDGVSVELRELIAATRNVFTEDEAVDGAEALERLSTAAEPFDYIEV